MPSEFVDAKLYELFGGYVGYCKTPVRIVQRQRLRIIAIMDYEAKQNEETERQQAERDAEYQKYLDRLGRQ